MKIQLQHDGRMAFTATGPTGDARLDARPPFGEGRGMNPKELVLAGLCGCTGMDVVGLLRKHKQGLERFTVEAEASMTEGDHPRTFAAIDLDFRLEGNIDAEVALESVRLSQTRYCGVAAVLSRALPIRYRVWVNGQQVGDGQAQFPAAD